MENIKLCYNVSLFLTYRWSWSSRMWHYL
jgi:hypothetical protein